jgi:hypothetical protein
MAVPQYTYMDLWLQLDICTLYCSSVILNNSANRALAIYINLRDFVGISLIE